MLGRSKYYDRSIRYGLIDLGHIIILGLCCGAFLLLLFVGGRMFVQSDTWNSSEPQKTLGTEFSPQTRACSIDTTQIGKRLVELEDSVAILRKGQETYIADLRQETNNIINKFNAWLGFWVGILTIFAGIVPIVIQYILRNKAQREKEEIMKEIRQYAMIHKIEMCVSSICIDKENPVIIDSSIKSMLINRLIYETNEDFGELISLVDSQKGILEPTAELQIINALIQYCRLIDGIKKNADRTRLRELNEMSDQIKKFIKGMHSDRYRTRETMWKKLRTLHSKLLGLRY